MDDNFYPQLDERTLLKVMGIYEGNPAYFDSPNCPYSPEVKAILKGKASVHDFDSHGGGELPDTDTVIAQLNGLIAQLKTWGDEVNRSNDENAAGEKNTYFRIYSGLIEKIIKMKEDASNIKMYEQFIAVILDIMDREMDADQRNRAMARLEPFVGGLTVPQKTSTPEINEQVPQGTVGENTDETTQPALSDI